MLDIIESTRDFLHRTVKGCSRGPFTRVGDRVVMGHSVLSTGKFASCA